jgi:endoglucanase Acf2
MSATGVNVTFGGTSQYLAIGTLTAPADLKTYTPYAYAIPRDTRVSWYYQPEAGQVRTMWEITAENLKGEANTDVLQGFIPHHYARTGLTFAFNGKEYFTPRGKLKLATGKKFEIVYRFNGMLPMLPTPQVVTGAANPYLPDRMKQLLDEYATVTAYGADTYWGGKDVEKFAMYMFMSKLMGNTASYDTLKATLRGAMVDWLTYTPGEAAHFFASYYNWKALVGMQPSYWSEQFTDNHFHYGYFTLSAALLAMVDPDFRDKYGPMATLVAKQYANYNRDDKSFPLFRTLDPWKGYSNAGGFSDPGSGNNQESSSESMQSWGGMFLLGAAIGNDAMRDAAAFGWAMESQAIDQYYFDRQETNFPPEWTHMISTPVRDDHIGYWNYFSGDKVWEFAIQWLPFNTTLNHLSQDYDNAKAQYAGMQVEAAGKTEGSYGSGLGNVLLSFRQIADPDGTAKVFDDLWAANNATVRSKDTSGKTYWFTHSNRALGRLSWDWHTSIPTSEVFENATTKEYTAVAFNPTAAALNCDVYKGTTKVGSFSVPPGELAMDRKPMP